MSSSSSRHCFLRAKECSQCACLWWTKAPWVPISVVSLWRWQLAVDHHPAHTCTHRHKLRLVLWIHFTYSMGKFLWNVFIFTPPHIVFKHNIQTLYFSESCRCSVFFFFPLQNTLFSLLLHVLALYFLSILSHASVLSECRHLPMLVVMILSVRLVSCQTHRIYSGLFLMLNTDVLLLYTQGGKWLRVGELLSTNTV